MWPVSEKEPTKETIEEEDRGGFSAGTMFLSWQEEMGSGAQRKGRSQMQQAGRCACGSRWKAFSDYFGFLSEVKNQGHRSNEEQGEVCDF